VTFFTIQLLWFVISKKVISVFKMLLLYYTTDRVIKLCIII